MADKTKIDWCDASWNPVTGCWHGCDYCYARRMVARFQQEVYCCPVSHIHYRDPEHTEIETVKLYAPCTNRRDEAIPYPYGFIPTYHRYRLDIPKRWTRPRTIFVCSMADLFGDWVPEEWIREVIASCEAAPQHRYLFLTKNPRRYAELIKHDVLPTKDNYWYGSTTARADDKAFYCQGNALADEKYCKTFLSIEPILERFGKGGEGGSVALTDWVIVGAESGTRKGKVIPEKEWIMELAEECDKRGKPIFMKGSLREIMGDDFRQEFPWEAKA